MRVWMLMIMLLSAGIVAGRATAAGAQSPPTRAFGSVTIDGQPAPLGTVVQAVINDKLCGEGVVRFVNDALPQGYVVDVQSNASSSGCGADGDTIRFRVGGVEATETGEFQTGTFLRLDLTVAGQVATPAAGATPPPFGAEASPTPIPAVAPTVAPAAGGASPTAAPPDGSGSPTATPEATATGTADAGPTATPTDTPHFTATPSAVAQREGSGGGNRAALWAAAAAAVLAAAGGAAYWLYRRNQGA